MNFMSMMYDLDEINMKTVADPKGFCEECEENYNGKIREVSQMIAENLKNSPIVLLAGPSGSAKTTTAMKISEELNRRGIGTHYVSMDDYFNTVGENTPRTPEGDYDLESPLCLDMDLMTRHFDDLEKGKRIYVPKYEFSRRMRVTEPSKSIRLKKDEICIFEGIHALNDQIAHGNKALLQDTGNGDLCDFYTDGRGENPAAFFSPDGPEFFHHNEQCEESADTLAYEGRPGYTGDTHVKACHEPDIHGDVGTG